MAAKAAAKIRYLGPRTRNFGRPLWEIVLNLKNFGAGRLVVRSADEIYKEPTYYRIVSAEPHQFEYPDKMAGSILAEPTFRGRKFPLEDIGNIAWQDDFKLLHKHEEEEFKNRGPRELKPDKVLPKYGSLPPLWKEVLRKEKGRELNEEETRIRMQYIFAPKEINRVAEEGEKPSFEAGPGHFKPLHMSLYEGVSWTRQPKTKTKTAT